MNLDATYGLCIINAIKSGCYKSNGNSITDFVSTADNGGGYGYGVAVGINCSCSKCVSVDAFVNADFRSFCCCKSYFVVNPLCIQGEITCRHCREFILRG